MTTQRTGYVSIFNSIDDLLDPFIWVPNSEGRKTMLTKETWNNFNTWCDAIHIDCDPLDPEVQTDAHISLDGKCDEFQAHYNTSCDF